MTDAGVEGEVTRVDAVRYLQGALGHAVGSTLFLSLAGLFWLFGMKTIAYVGVVMAFLLSANGLSIWIWDRLQGYFEGRTRQEPDDQRTLTASPLDAASIVELKAGAVMTGLFVALLVVGRLAILVLSPRFVAFLCVVCLAVGNIVALAKAVYG